MSMNLHTVLIHRLKIDAEQFQRTGQKEYALDCQTAAKLLQIQADLIRDLQALIDGSIAKAKKATAH